MLCLAMRAMGVGQLLRHARERFRVDVNAGRNFAAGIGTLDEQDAHDATPIFFLKPRFSHRALADSTSQQNCAAVKSIARTARPMTSKPSMVLLLYAGWFFFSC